MKTVLLFGGRSAEHDVSVLSARSITSVAVTKVELIPMCIARDGRFMTPERSARVLAGNEPSLTGDADFSFELWSRTADVDLYFPLIHGANGEDGALQGYLEILGLPYSGSGVTASAVTMDKVHMKQAFASAKLPLVDFVPVHEHDWRTERERVTRAIANALRLPYFVKPANGGSSVGVTKVKNDRDLEQAVAHALRFDEKVLIERGIDAREIEVAVLGNESPLTSVPGEIAVGREFYDYEDKYVEKKSSLIIPAKLTKDKADELRRHAITAFKAVNASGFSRVDFFMERGTNRLYVNEINSIPGFTAISMYPKLWEATEMKYPRLVERLIELGLERAKVRKRRIETTMQWFDDAKPIS